MTIIIFIVILAILILSHELGHFLAAKWVGIRVDEFGLGFPPRLVGWKKGETTYSLNIIPFGGFVKIFGETPDEESISGPDKDRSLIAKPKWKQAVVMAAGVFFNFVLAWFVISLGFMIGLPTPSSQVVAGDNASRSHLVITSILPNSPAELSGLKVGDELIDFSSPEAVQKFISDHANQELRLNYFRGNLFDENTQRSVSAAKFVTVKPVSGLIDNKAAIGISMDNISLVKKSFFLSLWEGAKLTYDLGYTTATTLFHFVVQAFQGQSGLSAVTGPVGLVGLVGDARLMGFVYLLSFMALISINLGIINLVPFPALDGGRILFLIIEKIKGSAINPKIANTVNLVGFALLLLLMAVVTYHDIFRLVVK